MAGASSSTTLARLAATEGGYMNEGWIKIHSKMLQWEWFSDANTAHLFLFCILSANFKDKSWRGIDVKRGSFVSSLGSISKATGLSLQQTRTSIDKLVKTGEISKQATNKYHIITINRYDDYQLQNDSLQQTNNNQITNNQQTNNKQITTTEDRKKEINKERNISVPFLPETRDIIKSETINFDSLAEYWNTKTNGVFRPILSVDFQSNEERRQRTQHLIDSVGKANFIKAIEKAMLSDLLTDRTRAHWFCYDWFIIPSNFAKIINGTFDNKPKHHATTKSDSQSILQVSRPTDGAEADF